MHAYEKPLTFLRDTPKYKIPFFQRSYVWKEDNWKELWEELVSARTNSFLGSIILKRTSINGKELKLVIDGQQRLTTLSILTKCLMDHLEKTAGTSTINSILNELIFHTETIFTKGGFEENRSPRIEHSRLDKMAFETVLYGTVDESNSHSIIQCYHFFEKQFAVASLDEVNHIVAKVAGSDSKLLVVIDLDENDDEQIIFDTINSAGVKLTAADIIKNAMYQKIDNGEPDTEEHYNEYWKKTFEQDQDTVDMWLETKGTGQNIKTYIDLFFHCFAIMRGFFDPTNDKIAELADKYKAYIKNKSVQETKLFIEDICANAKKYKEIFIGYDSVTGYKYDQSKDRLLHILNTIKITIFDAYILYVVSTYDENECERRFKLLETYIIRNYVLGNSNTTKSYNQKMKEMLEERFVFEEELRAAERSDSCIEAKLKSMGNNPAKLVLFWIELYLRATTTTSDQNETGLTYNYQLEHVMPQSWQENWAVVDCPVLCNGVPVADAEQAAGIRGHAIYEIGNMTLLTAKLNGQISNSSFKDKVEGREIKGKFAPGIRQNSSLRITVEDIVNQREWNEDHISARTKKITNLFKEMWPIPTE